MNLEEILYSRKCWVCGAELKDDEWTVCKFYHRNKKSPNKALKKHYADSATAVMGRIVDGVRGKYND